MNIVRMMTSSNGNISRVTGPLCGKFPSKSQVTRSFDVFFDLRLNKRFGKQSWRWWFETPCVFQGIVLSKTPGPLIQNTNVNLKTILSVQETRCGDKTVVRSSYLLKGMAILYRIRSRASRFEIPRTVPDYSYLIDPITTLFCAYKVYFCCCTYFIFLQS